MKTTAVDGVGFHRQVQVLSPAQKLVWLNVVGEDYRIRSVRLGEKRKQHSRSNGRNVGLWDLPGLHFVLKSSKGIMGLREIRTQLPTNSGWTFGAASLAGVHGVDHRDRQNGQNDQDQNKLVHF